MVTVAIFSCLAGLGDLLGGWLTVRFALSRERVSRMTALGTGILLGGALLTMLPGAVTASPRGAEYVAAGYVILLLVRRLSGHHRRGRRSETEAAGAAFGGLMLHSLLDGAALGVASRADPRLGLLAFLAIFLHKVPEGFSLAAVVLAATTSRRLAVMAAAAVGLATVLGAAAAALWAGHSTISHGALMGIAAGSLLFIASSDMVPAVERTGWNTWLMLVGILLVRLLAGSAGHRH